MAQLIQAMTAPTPCLSKTRVLVAQTDKYNDDLSEGLPVINNTTNLGKGLPVINNTSAKMTCVVDDLCGCPLNQCVDDLCG